MDESPAVPTSGPARTLVDLLDAAAPALARSVERQPLDAVDQELVSALGAMSRVLARFPQLAVTMAATRADYLSAAEACRVLQECLMVSLPPADDGDIGEPRSLVINAEA